MSKTGKRSMLVGVMLVLLLVLGSCYWSGIEQGPTAAMSWFPLEPEIGETVIFVSDSVAGSSSNPIVAYCWEIDGQPVDVDAEEMTYVFSSPGRHFVTLTVTCENGLSDSIVRTIRVAPTPPEYRIDIRSLGPDYCNFYVGDWLEMSLVTNDPKGTEAVWEFGDRNHATGAIVKHSYQECGMYQVEVRIDGRLVCWRRIMIQELH